MIVRSQRDYVALSMRSFPSKEAGSTFLVLRKVMLLILWVLDVVNGGNKEKVGGPEEEEGISSMLESINIRFIRIISE